MLAWEFAIDLFKYLCEPHLVCGYSTQNPQCYKSNYQKCYFHDSKFWSIVLFIG